MKAQIGDLLSFLLITRIISSPSPTMVLEMSNTLKSGDFQIDLIKRCRRLLEIQALQRDLLYILLCFAWHLCLKVGL